MSLGLWLRSSTTDTDFQNVAKSHKLKTGKDASANLYFIPADFQHIMQMDEKRVVRSITVSAPSIQKKWPRYLKKRWSLWHTLMCLTPLSSSSFITKLSHQNTENILPRPRKNPRIRNLRENRAIWQSLAVRWDRELRVVLSLYCYDLITKYLAKVGSNYICCETFSAIFKCMAELWGGLQSHWL